MLFQDPQLLDRGSYGPGTPPHGAHGDPDSTLGASSPDPPEIASNGDHTELDPCLASYRAPEDGEEQAPCITAEAMAVARLAAPLAAANLASFSLNLVTIAFVGRMGARELAVAVLATSLFNVTGLAIVQGVCSAFETFLGSWGAGNYRGAGIALQRALLINTVIAAAFGVACKAAPALLRTLRQDPGLIGPTTRYLGLMAPGLWFASVFEALKRFLAAQGEANTVAAVTAAALVLFFFYNWALIYAAGMGLDGAALAVVAVNATLAAGLAALGVAAQRRRRRRGAPFLAWPGWSTEVFTGLGSYLTHAGPAIAMLCAEWWTFESLVIFAGWLPNPRLSLAVMGICMNLSALIWSAVSGLGLACSARVATALGAGRPAAARRAAFAALTLGVLLELGAVVVVLAFRNSIGRAFTSSAEVAAAVAALAPVFALSLPGDGANCVLQGLLRGTGMQGLGSVVNMCCYWGLSLPAAWLWGVSRGGGVAGLWAAIAAVNTLLGVVMLGIALRIDFGRQAALAAARSDSLAAPLLAGTPDDGDDSDVPSIT